MHFRQVCQCGKLNLWWFDKFRRHNLTLIQIRYCLITCKLCLYELVMQILCFCSYLFHTYLVNWHLFPVCVRLFSFFYWPLGFSLSKFIIIVIIMFVKFCYILTAFLRIILHYYNILFLFFVLSPCVYCLLWIYNNTEDYT